MENRVVQFYVGVMVVSALIIAGILAMIIGEFPGLTQGEYTIYVHFPQAPGVTSGTPIRKSGILVGRVENVKFAEEDPRNPTDTGVVVAMLIKDDVRIRNNEMFTIEGMLLGDATIQVVPSDIRGAPPTVIEPDSYIADGRVRPDALAALQDIQTDIPKTVRQVGDAAVTFRDTAVSVRDTSDSLGRVVDDNEEQIKQLIQQASRAMASFERVATGLEDILGDEETRENIRVAIERLPNVIDRTETTLQGIDQAFKRLDSTMERLGTTIALVDRSLEDIGAVTARLRDQGPLIVDGVYQTVQTVNDFVAQLDELAAAATSEEGTLNMLLTNPDLYQKVLSTATNIEEISREIKPIIADIRVFSDKIARHPGVIVRDAVKPNSGLK